MPAGKKSSRMSNSGSLSSDLFPRLEIVDVSNQYTDGSYATRHPTWHVADSPWKADQILRMLDGASVESICEVGCGAGEILRQLHDRLPDVSQLVGYEIAEAPLAMASSRTSDRLAFRLKDAAIDDEQFDLMLIMDVIEHVPDPIAFLSSLRFKAKRTFLHVPLELSVQSVLRRDKLIKSRAKSGHIHYFTPETAIATVEDAGYVVHRHLFTRSFDLPPQSVKAYLARIPRNLMPQAMTIRILGGYSMLIDASVQ
ncbi:MAG TPA: methyltransferase domain-containing protein [Solirubrobacteraceae bacterium]|jgi:SAM-dependent methyltransferase